MERRELRHDRHTVSLLTDHMVFSPKYRGKILVGDVALALDGIIRKTYKDPDIDMAMNVDQVHLFVEYPPKYSVSYIAKRIKGRSSRELRKADELVESEEVLPEIWKLMISQVREALREEISGPKKQPGFEAVFAIVGLSAVAYLLRRRG